MNRIFILLLLLCLGCKHRTDSESDTILNRDIRTVLRYAQGFKVSIIENSKLVEVMYPYQGATSGYQYLLVPKGQQPPSGVNAKIIFTPIESIACTSTTHIPLLDYLSETDKLTGFTTTDYISSEKMRKRIDAGKVTELGVDNGINLERLAVLEPDMLMGYTMNGDYGQFKKIEELKIPVVLNAEYLEKHPLGRAEWIKFMALFFNKEKQADSVFREIEKNYLSTKSLADTVRHKPTVLSGIMYGDAWFMPGGQNYAAKILKDAGCDYLWSNDSSHGFLQIPFETVYERAREAELWIGTGTFKSLRELENADDRYGRFYAFQRRQVYSGDMRTGAKGGSEFLELGYLRPDIILNDLVKIAHPNLLPKYELYFHKKID
jgi:iron complex transport system substrate-binding protein